MNNSSTFTADADDFVDSTIFFGEIKKTIISKNFRGGRVHNVFDSTRLDFTNADINGVVVLDISQTFGETKLIVPRNWRVETDVSHFCSVTEDKRRDLSETRNSDKVLVVTGVSAFAVIKVKTSGLVGC